MSTKKAINKRQIKPDENCSGIKLVLALIERPAHVFVLGVCFLRILQQNHYAVADTDRFKI